MPYDIEYRLRVLAQYLYIIAIYDCCRDKVDTGPMRGGGLADMDEVGFVERANYIAFYGCAPT